MLPLGLLSSSPFSIPFPFETPLSQWVGLLYADHRRRLGAGFEAGFRVIGTLSGPSLSLGRLLRLGNIEHEFVIRMPSVEALKVPIEDAVTFRTALANHVICQPIFAISESVSPPPQWPASTPVAAASRRCGEQEPKSRFECTVSVAHGHATP